MSVNRNRSKSDHITDGRTYRLMEINENYPPYWEEGYRYHKSKGICKWKTKQLLQYEVRMYRTWKHNRKTQWKE